MIENFRLYLFLLLVRLEKLRHSRLQKECTFDQLTILDKTSGENSIQIGLAARKLAPTCTNREVCQVLPSPRAYPKLPRNFPTLDCIPLSSNPPLQDQIKLRDRGPGSSQSSCSFSRLLDSHELGFGKHFPGLGYCKRGRNGEANENDRDCVRKLEVLHGWT